MELQANDPQHLSAEMKPREIKDVNTRLSVREKNRKLPVKMAPQGARDYDMQEGSELGRRQHGKCKVNE